ncbi:hypothetical protein FS837_009695 [Tulasnella sp. UAMH 9824]|nr:hypothetical protein FS837_009695 [Tulasnella sp. UAMH 9824]
MDFSSESTRDSITSIVADSSRRRTSPATSLAPRNQAGLNLIDKYLKDIETRRDDYVDAMNLKLLALRSQRNLHASIHRLPVELLVYIFQLSLPDPKTGMPYLEALRTFLWVCTYWADVISAATSLWRVVSSMCSPRFLVLSLERLNSNCPLHIDCDGASDEELILILSQISPHIHRWETANIAMPETEEGRQYLSRPAPRLRRLHLCGNIIGEPNHPTFDIFNGSADRLEEVKVTRAGLPWDSPILRGIKSLDLQCCTTIRVSDIVSVLNTCSDLSTLIIGNTGIEVDMQSDPSKVVTMERLECIKFIVGELEGIEEIMKAFYAPNCKAFKFYGGSVLATGTENFIFTTLAPYFPFFRRMMFERPKAVIDISNLNKFQIQCPLEMPDDDFVGFNLYFSETTPDILMAFLDQALGEDESHKPAVTLIIGRDWREEGITILDEVSSHCNVVNLWLGGRTELGEFDAKSTLRCLARPTVLPNLRQLIISGDGWNAEEIKAILWTRYDRVEPCVVPLRIRFIGRGVKKSDYFMRDLEMIPEIEEAFCNQKTRHVDKEDL